MTDVYNTIPEHRIITSYYSYVSSYWLKKATSVQKRIGVANYPNGLTPDVVKFDPDYRTYYLKAKEASEIAKLHVPKAAKLKNIVAKYHKLYDMGQRIKINNHIAVVNDSLLQIDCVIDLSEYVEILKDNFENFKIEE